MAKPTKAVPTTTGTAANDEQSAPPLPRPKTLTSHDVEPARRRALVRALAALVVADLAHEIAG